MKTKINMKLKHIIRQLQQIESQHGDLDIEFVTHLENDLKPLRFTYEFNKTLVVGKERKVKLHLDLVNKRNESTKRIRKKKFEESCKQNDIFQR
jgi:hypothetical protein